MITLIKLILAHLLGDFLLQPQAWVADKERKKARSYFLYLHAAMHSMLVLLLFWSFEHWLLASLLGLIHLLIDLLKLYAQNKKSRLTWFIIDQGLHLASIMLLYVLFFKPSSEFLSFLQHPHFWIYSTALLLLSVVSSIVMQQLMASWSKSLNESNEMSLPNAGKYIGILERLFVFTFVVTGHWEGIGFLIAAKSVLRFGDLKESKDRKLTEYILIGTLLSFAIALATGMVALQLIELVDKV